MKNPKPFNLEVVLVLIMCCLLFIACKKDQKETEGKAYDTAATKATDSTCACQDNWFPHSQTPAPQEGKGSPFDVSSTTNCIFHQWSWQKFLWLTKPQANNNPLFLNELTQVNDALSPVQKIAGATIVLNSATDIEQAGTNGVLKANPAYSGANAPTDFTVYYSIHSNDIMREAALNFKDSLQAGTLPADNLRTFPVGSLELKVAWIDANTIKAADQGNYFITGAAVTTDGGKTYTRKKVALLGMHVVGVVINHPEFIWATFQHKDIAPVYDWKANQANSTNQKLLYAQGTTTGLDGITWGNTTPNLPYKPYDLFHYGVPLTPGGQYMKTAQQEPMNFNNIQSINDCVAGKLNDVWNNYFYNGSLWLNTDGLTPTQQAQLMVKQGNTIASALPGASARGSMNNANITMETYAQTFESSMSSINAGNLTNCFSCHNAVSFSASNPRSPLYISHIFDAYIQSSQGKTRTQINSMKDKQQVLQFGKKGMKK